jgi:hypothetical protein
LKRYPSKSTSTTDILYLKGKKWGEEEEKRAGGRIKIVKP